MWSGAHLFPRRTIYDFRVQGDDAPQLTFILETDMMAAQLQGGAYISLDAGYQVGKVLPGSAGRGIADIHDYRQLNNGRSLVLSSNPRYYKYLSNGEPVSGWVLDSGFQEMDEGGHPVFEWWALDHLEPTESYAAHSINSVTEPERSWDFL